MIKSSRHSYSDTIARLTAGISSAGNTLFASIDQAEAAASVGLSLRPTTLLVFGNPKAGTPLMDAYPLAALELPLKLLVWEENGSVSLAYTPMSEIAARYGIPQMEPRVGAIDQTLAKLTDALA